jgi:small subunit ribosomal protein SAe
MSSGFPALELKSDDARKILAAKMHLGSNNCNYQMNQYVFKRNAGSGAHVFDIQKMWEKILLAARIIAAIDNPADVAIVSSKDVGQRATLKCAKFIRATSMNGRFSPGSFTNHSQAGFREPRLIIVTDPSVDHQAIREASYVNIPVVALCDADSPIKYIDVCIPCNNKSAHGVGLAYWFLAREVQRLKGHVSRTEEWDVMPDLFFYRAPEDIKKQEEEENKAAADEQADNAADHAQDDYAVEQTWEENAPQNTAGQVDDWSAQAPAANQDWTAEQTAGNADWAQAEAGNGW